MAAICGVSAFILCTVLGVDVILYAIGAALYDWRTARQYNLIDLTGVYLALVAYNGWTMRSA